MHPFFWKIGTQVKLQVRYDIQRGRRLVGVRAIVGGVAVEELYQLGMSQKLFIGSIHRRKNPQFPQLQVAFECLGT